MVDSPLGIGILGAGMITPPHLAGFQEIPGRARVVAVCDLDRERAENLALLCDAAVYTDYLQMIADPAVELVDILLPHHLHYPAALAVIRSRKHLLLEKPVALTYQQALEIYQAAQAAGIHFGVAENTRFIPAYQAAEKIIRSGSLGSIHLVRTFLPANERIRLSEPDFWGRQASLGGGVLLDCGAHTFYLLKWLFGEIDCLTAFTAQLYQDGRDIEDHADVRGRLACGAEFLCCFNHIVEIPHSERLEIYGAQGSLIIDQLANPPAKLYADPTDYDGTPLDGVQYDPLGWHYFSIVEEVKDFIDTLWNSLPPTVDPRDCLYALRVIEAAYHSARHANKPNQLISHT
jgi:UDP-N-acetyl-2-amino-2-deoxyglucuronate dehydrogenase